MNFSFFTPLTFCCSILLFLLLNGLEAQNLDAGAKNHNLARNNDAENEMSKYSKKFDNWMKLAIVEGKAMMTEANKMKLDAEITQLVAGGKLHFHSKFDGTVLWSGQNRVAAQEWAAQQKGKCTLEQTEGGHLLNSMDLFDSQHKWAAHGMAPPLSATKASALWDIAARQFVQQAQGDVFIFAENVPMHGQFGGVKYLRTLYRLELPMLLANRRVKRFWRMGPNGRPIDENSGGMNKLEACQHYLSKTTMTMDCREYSPHPKNIFN